MNNRVALLIGGNQGDRHALLQQATVLIQERIGAVVAVSKVYETEPWGDFGVENDERKVESFFNQALLVDTPLEAHTVLYEALAIETALGRLRPHPTPCLPLSTRTYYSRTMDIDLIFFNNDIINTEDLTIPHPRAHLRRFVLEPLAEIMPDYKHPLLGRTVKQLLYEI